MDSNLFHKYTWLRYYVVLISIICYAWSYLSSNWPWSALIKYIYIYIYIKQNINLYSGSDGSKFIENMTMTLSSSKKWLSTGGVHRFLTILKTTHRQSIVIIFLSSSRDSQKVKCVQVFYVIYRFSSISRSTGAIFKFKKLESL